MRKHSDYSVYVYINTKPALEQRENNTIGTNENRRLIIYRNIE